MKSDLGLLILRVGAGAMMLFSHGWPKLMNFSTISANFPDPLGVGSQISLALAVFAEVFCSAAVILGLFTRFSAIPLVITMLVAALIVHANDPFAKKEFALLYGVTFLALVLLGSGRLSLDALMGKKQG